MKIFSCSKSNFPHFLYTKLSLKGEFANFREYNIPTKYYFIKSGELYNKRHNKFHNALLKIQNKKNFRVTYTIKLIVSQSTKQKLKIKDQYLFQVIDVIIEFNLWYKTKSNVKNKNKRVWDKV